MQFHFITLFPNELKTFLEKGIFKQAVDKRLISFSYYDLREHGFGKHHKVDDYAFAMKQGMLLRADVLHSAITSIAHYQTSRILYPCPKGKLFTQNHAKACLSSDSLIFVSGYYEGVDERIFDLLPIEKVSVGSFVLSSGDTATALMAEVVSRLIPGVVGKAESVLDDSVISGRLEHPQYTVPREVVGLGVPDVLLSGHHQRIENWMSEERAKITLYNSPGLYIQNKPGESEMTYLTSLMKE